MKNKIFWLAVQGIVGMHNQSLILQDMIRFLLYDLQKQILTTGVCEMERSWIVLLILLLMEQVELSCILQMALWYSQMVLRSLVRSLRDCWLSYMHRERERVHRMQRVEQAIC